MVTIWEPKIKLIRRQIMKRIACQFTYPTALVVTAAVLLAVMVFLSPGPSRAASPEPGLATAGTTPRLDHVDARIKELHAKLKITPAQEELWNKATQVMRDNAKTMEALIKARSEKTKTMTAVDDLKSYSEIAEAHADGLKKFIPVFEPLYTSMSDTQKGSADTLFRHHGHAKSKAKAKGK
jgi:periplasmic protein CpxP/Spy